MRLEDEEASFVDLGAKFPWPPPLRPKKKGFPLNQRAKKPPAEDLNRLIRYPLDSWRNGGSNVRARSPCNDARVARGSLVNVEPETEKVLALFFSLSKALLSTCFSFNDFAVDEIDVQYTLYFSSIASCLLVPGSR